MTCNTSSLKLEATLAEIEAIGEEGHRIFSRLYIEEAREAARAADARTDAGRSIGGMDGRLVSIMDLFDVKGEATVAGSLVRQGAEEAEDDALVVRRLRAAGAVIVGKTNMSEFAFSGVGLNPHYGTPGNTHDLACIPGGSSSGAGVAVSRGLVEFAIGSDTEGSARIPSALNGIVGFKSTQSRVSRVGYFPLSYTLDTVGLLCRSVADAQLADAILTGEEASEFELRGTRGLRVGIPRGLLFTETQSEVLAFFNRSLEVLSRAGASVRDVNLDSMLRVPFDLQQVNSILAAEAAYIHCQDLDSTPENFDPLLLSLLLAGETMSASWYVGIKEERHQCQSLLDWCLFDLDVLLLPTVPIIAPLISDVQTEESFMKINALLQRNSSVFNFYDLPALSLPLATSGRLPVGMMIVGRRGRDRDLLAVSAAIEKEVGLRSEWAWIQRKGSGSDMLMANGRKFLPDFFVNTLSYE